MANEDMPLAIEVDSSIRSKNDRKQKMIMLTLTLVNNLE